MLELGKVRITFFVAVTTSIGYIFFSRALDWGIVLPSIGVFILSSGSSAFNHYQERFTDALMDRTKGRPIPSGRISSAGAFIAASTMVLSGLAMIYFSGNLTAMLLGLLALIWYNLVYTPLKKKYAMAVVPGSLIGAIPPVIGWAAAGGNILDFRIISLAMFFFIWQIPHFWLLLLIYGKDYEKAGFPTLTQIFSNEQLSRITYVWIIALTISCLLIPVFDLSTSIVTLILVMASGVWLIWKSTPILTGYLERMNFRNAFININLYVLAVSFILSLDKLFLNEL